MKAKITGLNRRGRQVTYEFTNVTVGKVVTGWYGGKCWRLPKPDCGPHARVIRFSAGRSTVLLTSLGDILYETERS